MKALPLLAALCFGSAAAQQGVETRNHRSLSLLFLRFLPAPEALAPGEQEWSASYANGNDFRAFGPASDPTLFEDHEVSRLAVRWRKSFREGEEVFAEVPFVVRGPGFMDDVISWWHANILGSRFQRDAFPANRSRLFLEGRHDEGSAHGLGDASVGYRRDLAAGWTLRAAVELPTGSRSRLLGSGAVDAGVCADVRFGLGRGWALLAQAGLVAQGGGGLRGVRGLADQESVAVVWSPNSRDSWIVQWQSERAPVTTGVPGADATHRLVTLGYRTRLSDGESLELYFTENGDLFNGRVPEIASVGSDFTFGVSYGLRR